MKEKKKKKKKLTRGKRGLKSEAWGRRCHGVSRPAQQQMKSEGLSLSPCLAQHREALQANGGLEDRTRSRKAQLKET